MIQYVGNLISDISKLTFLNLLFYFILEYSWFMGFSGSSAGKESACNAGNPGSIPESERSPGEEMGYPLQYSMSSLAF